jgi:hypothetical protein
MAELKHSTLFGIAATVPANLVALAWQAYTYPLVPLLPGKKWSPMKLDLSPIIPLQRALAVGLIVKLGLDAYDMYLDWIDDKARQLKNLQKEQEEKDLLAAELKYTHRAAIERDLMDQIKRTLQEVIDLKIVESEVFPTRKIKIFVLQNIQDFFTFAHKPELNLFVYQAATQMINDLQRDLLMNKSTNQEIVTDTYRDYFTKKQSKPFSKMSDEELKAAKKDFELILKSNLAVASANITDDNEYEKAIDELMQESMAAEQKEEAALQKFKLPISIILEATALVSLITHIEFILNMRPKGEIFRGKELLQAEALQARKNEKKPSRKEQYQTIAAALTAKGVELTPIVKQKFPQQNRFMPIQNQEALLPAVGQKAPLVEQQNKPWYSKIFTWSYWFGNK